MKVKTNVILTSLKNIDSIAKINVFNAQCLSLYGCELWNLEDKNIKTLETTWRKCCRLVLNLPCRTHGRLIPYLVGTSDILTIIENRMINFFTKGIKHQNNLISFLFKNALIDSNNSYITSNINKIIKKT